MAFDWSLDSASDVPSEGLHNEQDAALEALGFTVEAPAAPLTTVPLTPVPLTRRELRMAEQRNSVPVPVAPVPVAPAAAIAVRPTPTRPPGRPAARPAKRSLRRRILPKVLSLGAMLGAGALLIATSVPANALMTTNADAIVPISHHQSQSLGIVNAKAVAQTSSRDKYTVISMKQQMALRFMSTNWSYTNDPNGTIQWPFPVQVPISSGFGPRQVAGCSFCSTYHEGIDFDPGQGVAIGAIADGVVSQVVESHAGLGNHVVIDHVVNGQQVQSVYAHMLDGSIKVVVGQTVKVTQEIGQVGSTGESTGAHLHLEIHVNNVPIDPFAWLKANAN